MGRFIFLAGFTLYFGVAVCSAEEKEDNWIEYLRWEVAG